MKIKEKTYDVGVIVGRFQTPTPHDAHLQLLKKVEEQHKKVILFLGISYIPVTMNNPLDFEMRKQMIAEIFPNFNILFIMDEENDESWSKTLDSQISSLVTHNQSVVLYGGRDSFIDHYTTKKYPTIELIPDVYISGTEVRNAVSKYTVNDVRFRHGVIWAVNNQFVHVYATVDCAIFNDDYSQVLLGRKPLQTKWQFVGGFADVNSESYEDDAIREVKEEMSIEIKDIKYVGSTKVDDIRYRHEKDKIKTLVFIAKYKSGIIKPSDDMNEAKWFDVKRLLEDNYSQDIIRPVHLNIWKNIITKNL